MGATMLEGPAAVIGVALVLTVGIMVWFVVRYRGMGGLERSLVAAIARAGDDPEGSSLAITLDQVRELRRQQLRLVLVGCVLTVALIALLGANTGGSTAGAADSAPSKLQSP